MKNRYLPVDALRGLIMVIMAIDHSSAFIARQHSSEWWAGAMTAYTEAAPFLTRLVTHLCAPGFFFLMGAGIYWFAAARRAAGWSEGQIAKRTALRGLAIFGLGQLLEAPVIFVQTMMSKPAEQWSVTNAPPPIDGTSLLWGLITLSGLGMAMMLSAAILRFGPWVWASAAWGSVVLTNTFMPADGTVGPLWETVLLAPGLSQHVMVIYPALPWFGATALGMCFAYWWKGRGEFWVGLGAIGLGVALRLAGGWGNIRAPRDGSWIEFLNNVKYPPSLVFLLLFIGFDLVLLAWLRRAPEGWQKALAVFGQTPLFYYLAHFYLLMGVGLVFFREAGGMGALYLVWALVVLGLYPVCKWYRGFKLGKPAESFWRMF